MSDTEGLPPYKNPEADIDVRVKDLLSRLTDVEKFRLCAGWDNWHTPPIDRLGVPPFGMTDGPHGVRSRCVGGLKTTYFPVAICMASTWNPELLRSFGRAIGEEVAVAGMNMLLAPGINICRTPLNGRTFEYYTEDPYLNGELVVASVTGIQSVGVAACVKHYVCNNQETRRTRVNVEVSERALREIYLPGFRAAVVRGKALAIMGAYNKINGKYACENEYLLRRVLTEEWGFKGITVSDWGATRYIKRTADCVRAGLCLEMGRPILYKPELFEEAIANGEISREQIDELVERLLRVMFLTGVFDGDKLKKKGSINTAEHRAVARKIAEEGIVLLKNEGLLPLRPEDYGKIAVVGPNADKKMAFGGGSSEVLTPYEITPKEGISKKLKEIAPGTEITDNAEEADLIIYVGGLSHARHFDTEGSDRKRYRLPRRQLRDIRRILKLNVPSVMILINGSPVAPDGWYDGFGAVLEAWYPGMEGGNVIADVLFGDVNPSGKLPITWPKRIKDCPAHKSRKTYPGGKNVYYTEDIYVGYRYYEKVGIEPLFPFGYGLSYTNFTIENPDFGPGVFSLSDNSYRITVELQNTGKLGGKEVVQLYIGNKECPEDRPVKELKGFAKIELAPGEKKKVEFLLSPEDFGYYSLRKKQFVIEPGKYDILIGNSSVNIEVAGVLNLRK